MGKRIDLTGQKFGRLTVISYNEEVSKQKGQAYWNCRCDCGNEKVVRGKHLKSGNTTSCGCLQRKDLKDLTGQKFGRLIVIGYNNEVSKQKKCLYWNCRCDCGNEKVVRGKHLKSGNTTSCGCYQKEKTIEATWKGGISPISDHLRHLPVISQWRKDTYIRENNKCQLTGKKVHGGNSEVHHLYGLNMIILEAHELNGIQIKQQVKDYTEEELHKLEEYVASWHKDTSNAVLLCKEAHDLFHRSKKQGGYGQGNNTPEQYEEFRERYMAGEFKNIL